MALYGLAGGVNKICKQHYALAGGVNKEIKAIYGLASGVNKQIYQKLITYEKYNKSYTRNDVRTDEIFLSRSKFTRHDLYKLSGITSISDIPVVLDSDNTPYYAVGSFNPVSGTYTIPTGGWSIDNYGSKVIGGILCSRAVFTYVRWTSTEPDDPFPYQIYGKGYIISINWVKGSYVGTVEAIDGTYPTNGLHTDGYWYVRVG